MGASQTPVEEWLNKSPTLKDDLTEVAQSDASEQSASPAEPEADHVCVRCRAGHCETIPQANSTYLMKHLDTNQFLVIKAGKLHLQSTSDGQVGSHWLCVERDGWLAFQNLVSGRYLSIRSDYYSRKKVFETSESLDCEGEYFITTTDPQGGSRVLALESSRYEPGLWRMGVSKGQIVGFPSTAKGQAWKFIEVD